MRKILSSREHPVRVGFLVGLAISVAHGFEMLAGNRATINPSGSLVLFGATIFVGTLVSVFCAWIGARAFRKRPRLAPVAALVTAALAWGTWTLPAGLAPIVALALGAGVWLRARAFPARVRLDDALVLTMGLALSITLVLSLDRELVEREPTQIDAGQLLGEAQSVVVTWSEHSKYPEVPALHLDAKSHAPSAHAHLAALLTGRIPERNRTRGSTPRLLTPDSGLGWWPDRLWPQLFTAALPVASLESAVFAPRRSFADYASSANVLVLEDLPEEETAPMRPELRVVRVADVSEEEARTLQAWGAWIHVDLHPEARIVLSGRGIALRPATEEWEAREVSLLDVAPTALHLLGAPVPRDFDGRVLVEFLAEPGGATRSIRYY